MFNHFVKNVVSFVQWKSNEINTVIGSQWFYMFKLKCYDDLIYSLSGLVVTHHF